MNESICLSTNYEYKYIPYQSKILQLYIAVYFWRKKKISSFQKMKNNGKINNS